MSGRTTALTRTLRRLLPTELPSALNRQPGNLYEILSRQPGDLKGRKVHQCRWTSKKIEDCYWEVSHGRFKCEGKHGRVWGVLFWKGKQIHSAPTRIRGGLKYRWQVGISGKTASSAPVTLDIARGIVPPSTTKPQPSQPRAS